MPLPLAALPEFITRTAAALPREAAGGGRVSCFDDVGEANRHSNVYPAVKRNRAECDNLLMRVTETVRDVVHNFGGSVSPEPRCGLR